MISWLCRSCRQRKPKCYHFNYTHPCGKTKDIVLSALSHSATICVADFFDAGVAPSTSKDEEEEETKPQSMAEKLPEGFFDNPKEDAKVRITCSDKTWGQSWVEVPIWGNDEIVNYTRKFGPRFSCVSPFSFCEKCSSTALYLNLTFCQVRQVEYKDKMDEEWELFTRAMKEQSVVSNQGLFVQCVSQFISMICFPCI